MPLHARLSSCTPQQYLQLMRGASLSHASEAWSLCSKPNMSFQHRFSDHSPLSKIGAIGKCRLLPSGPGPVAVAACAMPDPAVPWGQPRQD